jgi:hypothetical protein
MWVELDRLIVYQRTINLRVANGIEAGLSPAPTERQLVDIATGRIPLPPVSMTRSTDNTFFFSCGSSDFRFLDVVDIDPDSVGGRQPSGRATNMVGIYMGFGVNFISAFRVAGRAVLQNGSHRAYALRAAGITRVPCWVADVRSEEDLALAAPPEFRQNKQLYLEAPRPPLFKDYFDPSLRVLVPTVRRKRLLQVQMTFQQLDIPAV